MKKAFSLIELIIIVIVIGILASSVNFSLTNSSLNQATDQVINHIRYTQQLAIRDDKYQAYPLDSTSTEGNRSKYWYKQWWHFKLTDGGGDIIYYILSDKPSITGESSTTFNNKVTNSYHDIELAKNVLDDTYIIGANIDDTGNINYPSKVDTYKKANLTKYYGIQKVILTNGYSSSSMPNGMGNRIDILFDTYGTVYMREGDSTSNAVDTNPYDTNERKILTDVAKITLCSDTNCEQNKSICIYPETGYIKTCD
jgi:type II secretory pathway pseudopilin PulG